MVELLLGCLYVVAVVVVVAATTRIVRRREAAPMLELGSLEPYAIAYLRGGAQAALRTALVSLEQRGWLRREQGELRVLPHALDPAPDPLEQMIVAALGSPKRVCELLVLRDLPRACQPLAESLRRQRLLLRADDVRARWLLGALAIATMTLLGVVMIELGADRAFVALIVALALLALLCLLVRRRTAQGDRVLRELTQLLVPARWPSMHHAPQLQTTLGVAVIGTLPIGLRHDEPWLALRAREDVARAGSASPACGGVGCGIGCGGGCSGCGGGCGGCGGCGG